MLAESPIVQHMAPCHASSSEPTQDRLCLQWRTAESLMEKTRTPLRVQVLTGDGSHRPTQLSISHSNWNSRLQQWNQVHIISLGICAKLPDRPAGHGPLLQVNTTPSITDITGLLRTTLPRVGWGLVRAPGFLGDTQGTSNQTCCVGSSQHFNIITRSSAIISGASSGFPGGSDNKVSACNAGDLGPIPGLGRSPGEGNGNPLQ